MKFPSNKEEFLVWPPIGGGMGIFVGTTWFHLFPLYHELLLRQEDQSVYAGYVFPVAMAVAFAIRLHGKYWLGFGWVAFVSYCLALAFALFHPESGLPASMLVLFTCLSIMFVVQSLLLYAKRLWWRHEN